MSCYFSSGNSSAGDSLHLHTAAPRAVLQTSVLQTRDPRLEPAAVTWLVQHCSAAESGYCSCCRGRCRCRATVDWGADNLFLHPRIFSGCLVGDPALPSLPLQVTTEHLSTYYSEAGAVKGSPCATSQLPGRVTPLLQCCRHCPGLQHCSASRVFGTEGTDTSWAGQISVDT